MKLKRTLSLVTASLVLTTSLVGCGGNTEAPATATPEPTAPALVLEGIPEDMVLETTGVAGDTVVMTVDGAEVTADMLFYWTVATFDQYAQMGVTDWTMDLGTGAPISDIVLQAAYRTAVYHQVIGNKAAETDWTMSEEDWADFDSRVASLKTGMGAEEGKEDMAYGYWMAYMGIHPEAFNEMSQTAYAVEYLQDHYYGENGTESVETSDIEAWMEEAGVVNAKHILVMNQPSEDGEDDGSAAALEAAQAIREELTQGGDTEEVFDDLMVEYTEDVDPTGAPNNPQGYLFDATGAMIEMGGSLVPSFVEAGQALEVGEISDPVKSDYGYHILLRTAVDPATLEETYVANAMALLTEEWFDAAEVETTEDFDKVASVESYTAFNQEVRPAIMEGMDTAMPQEEAAPQESAAPEGE